MQAYSADLRARVVAAYMAGQCTIGQVASQFAVSVSFVDKLLKRQRTSGSVAALPARGGPAPCLQEVDRQHLAACVAAQPDATLAESGQQLVAAGSPAVGSPCSGRRCKTVVCLYSFELH
jgi:transposase